MRRTDRRNAAWPAGLYMVLAMAVLLMAGASAWADTSPPLVFEGTCGASAGVSLAADRIIVASDDDNWLRLYAPSEGGEPIGVVDLYPHLQVNEVGNRNFSAIEGAARVGDLVYWTASHSREEHGKNRPHRRRLFATSVAVGPAGDPVLLPYGRPVKDLTKQFEASSILKSANLGRSIVLWNRELATLAPEQRGLDIQGLAAGKDGTSLLLALRNPLAGTSALLIPILNPAEVITGSPAKFDDPIRLNLAGAGISSIEWVEALDTYLILANKVGERKGFSLYRWSGEVGSPAELIQELPGDLNAEGMIVADDGKSLLLVSDDSQVMLPVKEQPECRRRIGDTNVCPCEGLRDRSRWSFRGQSVQIDLSGFPPKAPVPPTITE